MAYNFNGDVMCRGVTECETEALRMCSIDGGSKSEIGC